MTEDGADRGLYASPSVARGSAGLPSIRSITGSSATAASRVVGPVLVVLLWYMASSFGLVDRTFVPTPGDVLATWYEWAFGSGTERYAGTWADHALASTRRVLVGFLIAAVVGVVLGVLIGWFRIVSNLLDPVVQIMRPIPITAWVPFAVIFFGISDASAYFLIALGAFFPIVVNTAAGVALTPPLLIRAARMLGIRREMLIPRVVLPSAMPYVFTGLRIGIGLAWVLVIVAEMLAVKSGLGFVLWDAYYFLRMDIIIAAMLSVGILGFLSDLAIRALGRRVLSWNEG